MLVMISKQRVCLPRHGSLASGNHISRQNALGNEEALLAQLHHARFRPTGVLSVFSSCRRLTVLQIDRAAVLGESPSLFA